MQSSLSCGTSMMFGVDISAATDAPSARKRANANRSRT